MVYITTATWCGTKIKVVKVELTLITCNHPFNHHMFCQVIRHHLLVDYIFYNYMPAKSN